MSGKLPGQQFDIGDRVVYQGEAPSPGTVKAVRETLAGRYYQVDWDDGQGSDIEYGEDELRAE